MIKKNSKFKILNRFSDFEKLNLNFCCINWKLRKFPLIKSKFDVF